MSLGPKIDNQFYQCVSISDSQILFQNNEEISDSTTENSFNIHSNFQKSKNLNEEVSSVKKNIESFPEIQESMQKKEISISQTSIKSNEATYQRKEKYEQISQEILQLVKNALKSDNNEWKKTDSKKQFTGYKIKDEIKKNVFTRGEGVINGTMEQVKSLIANQHLIEKAKIFTPFQKISEVLETYNDGNIKIYYAESNPPIISDLNAYLLSGQCIDTETGAEYFYFRTIDDPEGVKLKNVGKMARNVVPFQGWVLTPIKEDIQQIQKVNDISSKNGKKTNTIVNEEVKQVKVDFVSNIELDGFPNFIRNFVRKSRGLDQVKILNEYVQKLQKKEQK